MAGLYPFVVIARYNHVAGSCSYMVVLTLMAGLAAVVVGNIYYR
jgi:hypothetical protein